jgi:origin recognition complex subunit 3
MSTHDFSGVGGNALSTRTNNAAGRADARVPVGVVLAGGVNSDDHEETFAALTNTLRSRGDAHCALLRSRDLKARAGVGAGGVGVAFGRQLDRTGAHWGAKSMRALRRWYEETLVERVERIGDGTETTETGEDGEDEDKDALDPAGKKRGRDDSAPASPAGGRKLRRRGGKNGSQGGKFKGGRDAMNDESYPVIQGRSCPVVIVVEDTEGFDARVLDSFLQSVSEFVSSVPVIVLLGLATSVSTLQGMLPAATAAMLNARAFQLWAPGKMMEAVQEEVLLSPERTPAFGSDVLNTLHTRFKEHDFSLAAVRRALHLLTLTHFMTKPLSAACALLGTDPTTPRPDGEESDDEYADAIDQFVRDLDADSVVYARRKYLTGTVNANDDDAATRRALASALKDVYRLRKRWTQSLKCVQVVCEATETRMKKSVTTMADLLLDASRSDYFALEDDDDEESARRAPRRKSPGTRLLDVTCARLRDAFTTKELGELAKKMITFLDDDDVMRTAEGSELRFLLTSIEDGLFKDNEVPDEAMTTLAEDDEMDDDERVRVDARGDENAAVQVEANDENQALELLMNSRKMRGGFVRTPAPLRETTTTTQRTEDDADDGGLVLPKSPVRGRSAPSALPAPSPLNANTGALVVKKKKKNSRPSRSEAADAFCDIFRAVARKYASRPPESLPASGIFVITDVDCVRYGLQASPRLTLENTLTDPSCVLGCSCCQRDDGGDVRAALRIPRSLPDTAAAYRLLAMFGEQANIHDWFKKFCTLHASSYKSHANGGHASSKTTRAASASREAEAAEEQRKQQRGKGTFGLPRETLWELQARFTRAVAELEFLGIARPHQKGRKGVEYMVRTAFPLDKLSRDRESYRDRGRTA